MPTNDFLQFADDPSANVMDQASYLALAARALGFQSGIAQSLQLNKAWRQSAAIAAAVAQCVVNIVGVDMLDNGDEATHTANIIALIQRAAVGMSTSSPATGTNIQYTNADLGKNIQRSNTGTPMRDVLPGNVNPNVPLTNTGLLIISNADATAILSLTAGTGAIIHGYSRIYLGPGQSVTILSDGVNYWPIRIPDRCRLPQVTNIFVSTTGNDANSGMALADPLATVQAAWNLVMKSFDINGFTAKIIMGTGTHTQGLSCFGNPVGMGSAVPILIEGDVVTPANVILNTGTSCIAAQNGAIISIRGIQFTSSAGSAFLCDGVGSSIIGANCRFDFCASFHMFANHGAQIRMSDNYTIIGNATAHFRPAAGGIISFDTGVICTLTGTPAFSVAFAAATINATLDASVTFSGAATGSRYSSTLNAVINVNGGGANYLPGNSAGSTATGGQYA
jgi:hypothetical protein